MYCANVVCRMFCNRIRVTFENIMKTCFVCKGECHILGFFVFLFCFVLFFFQKLYEKFKHFNSLGIDCVKFNRTFVQIPQRPLIRGQYCSCSDKTYYVFGPSTCTNLHFSDVSSMVFQNTCSGAEKNRRFWQNSDDFNGTSCIKVKTQ